MKPYRKILSLVMAVLMLLALAACGAPAQQEAQPTPSAAVESSAPTEAPAATEAPTAQPTDTGVGAPAMVTDHAGRTITVEQPPQRIVSGYYISSSLCIALGLTDRLVGIEAKADSRPIYQMAAPQLIDLPNVGTAKEFDMEGCIALEPDLVILPLRLKDNASTMEGLGINVLLVNPESQKELEEVITMIATATGVVEQGEALIAYYHEKLAFLSDLAVSGEPDVYLVGGELLRTAPGQMYQSSVIANAHGVNVAADIADSSWVDISYEQLINYNPEYVIIIPESGVTVDTVLADKQLSEIDAVKNGKVYKMPTNFEAWDSPVPSGILGSLWLASVLHEDAYSFDNFKTEAAAFYETFYHAAINLDDITK